MDFLFGKICMPNQDLARWMSVKDFKDMVSEMVSNGDEIGDIEVLNIVESILDKDLNLKMIDGIDANILRDSAIAFRSNIECFKYDKVFLRKQFPDVWKEVKDRVSSGDVINPMQMSRFVQLLNYCSNLSSVQSVHACINAGGCGCVSVVLGCIEIFGSDAVGSLFGRARFCSRITVRHEQDSFNVRMSIPGVIVDNDKFFGEGMKKMAWTLKWNEDFKKEECAK